MSRPARNHTGHVVGEQHPRARLTDDEVREIRDLYVPRVRGCQRLASVYGVSPQTIHDIVTYATRWSAR